MYNELGIKDYYERVRSVLGGNVAVTDDIIKLPEYQLMAETYIILLVPNYSVLLETEKQIFESCVVYQTAINLFDYTTDNVMKIEQSPHVKTERFEINFTDKYNKLILKRDELLIKISKQYKDKELFSFIGFAVSEPYVNPNSML